MHIRRSASLAVTPLLLVVVAFPSRVLANTQTIQSAPSPALQTLVSGQPTACLQKRVSAGLPTSFLIILHERRVRRERLGRNVAQ